MGLFNNRASNAHKQRALGAQKRRDDNYFPFGVSVLSSTSSTTAEKHPTSIACMNLITSAIAAMPLDIFQGTKKATDHYLYPLLHDEPNRDETIDLFLKLLVRDYYNGNIFIYVYRNDRGFPASLFRVDPNTVVVNKDSFGIKTYKVGNKVYDYTNILHIPSPWGYDGKTSQGLFKYASGTFDIVKKVEDYLIYGMDNSFGKRLIVDLTNALPNATEEQITDLKAKFVSLYTGVANSGKPLFKNKKFDFSVLDGAGFDARSAQMVELREYQDNEILRLFGVPSSFINPDKYSTELENIYSLFVDNAVRPVANAIEKGLEKILYPGEREKYSIKFNYNSIMKTKMSERIDAYTKQLGSGILSINEVRQKENLDPIANGDKHFVNGGNWLDVENNVLITGNSIEGEIKKWKN